MRLNIEITKQTKQSLFICDWKQKAFTDFIEFF